MKVLRFNFCHPVKGNARLVHLSLNPIKCTNIAIDSRNNNLLEVPVHHCGEGKWEIVLNWEIDTVGFVYKKLFEIKEGAMELKQFSDDQ